MSAVTVAPQAPQQAPPGEPTLEQLGRHLVAWIKKNIPAVVVSAVIGTVVGFVTNIWLVAVIYQGTNGANAAGHGVVTATLLSGVATTVVFGVYGYYRAVGGAKFAADVRNLPPALVSLFTRDGAAGRIHLLWGAAISMVATAFISPGVGALLGVGLLASAPGILGRIVSTFIMRLWSQVLQKVAPTRAHRPPGVVSMSVGVLGGSGAMLAGYVIPATHNVGGIPTRLLLAVGCGAAAYFLGRQSPGASAAIKLLLLVAAGAVLSEILHPLLAWATDGGSAECGYDWGKYLTQCQGAGGVLAVSAAGGVASGVGAPVGYGVGNLAGGGDLGGDDGKPPGPDDRGDHTDDGGRGLGGPGPLVPPPPPPHFPHVFMRGGQIVIEVGNGVILSATPNPDGSVGPWSATNLNTQSGGAIDNQVTGDDGSVTTYYHDGSVVTKGADGSVQTWGPGGPDGQTYTNAVPGGDVTTTHPDGSVDVRSPDGTIATTSRDGVQTTQYPDGSTVRDNPNDGTSTTYHPDGSIDVSGPGDATQHRSSDGTITLDDGAGTTTTRLPDGTTTVENANDGSSSTHWPDGSAESTGADGTKVNVSADGTTYTHDPDGTVTTQNPDGSTETREPDGTISQTTRGGVETTWNSDGSVDTTHPDGTVVTHSADGTMSVTGPGGQDVGDPNARLHNLDEQSGYIQGHPEIYNAISELQRQVAANGGAWTPAELATLMAIQNAADGASGQRHDQIVAEQDQATKEWHQWLHDRDQKEQQAQEHQRALQAQVDKAQGAINKFIDDLPADQAAIVSRIMERTEHPGGPNAADLNTLRQLAGSVITSATGRSETAGARADTDAAWAGLGENAARNIRTGASVAEGVLMIGFGGGHLAMGQLGALYVGRNGIEGAIDGYVEGGVKGALWGTVTHTLPVNTLHAAYDATIAQVVDPNSPHGGVKDIFFGFVQDTGNAMQLQAGASQVSRLVAGEAEGGSNLIGRLAGESEGGPRPGAATEPGGGPRGAPEPGAGADPPKGRAWAEIDAEHASGQAKGQQLVDEYKDLRQQAIKNPEDPALQRALQDKVHEINSDGPAKTILKGADMEVNQDFAGRIKNTYSEVDQRTCDTLNSSGARIGGREITPNDLKDLRNAASKTIGQDRDLALNEERVRMLKSYLSEAEPGSQYAQQIQTQLSQASADIRLTGPDGARLSNANWNKMAQNAYNDAYHAVTGQDAGKAMQSVTQQYHPEAYRDLNVLQGKPASIAFDPGSAAQTGSVTSFKAIENFHNLPYGEAVQETARGMAKDISTKLEPLLSQMEGTDMNKYVQTLEMKNFLQQVGTGQIPPSVAQAQAVKLFGTDIQGLVGRVDANIQAAIQRGGMR